MGWTVGIPSMKLNNGNRKSKHCGNFYLIAAEALSERIGRDPDINPELLCKNIYYGYNSAAELLAYSSKHCSTLTDAKGRALRADAVRMCVTLFKPPAAYMATLTETEQKMLILDGIEKIREIVGNDNVKSVAIHFDEQGAHAHIFWEPMTQDGRLCAKEMHNLKFLGRLNKEMPEFLRSRGWDIDDCDAYDEALHRLMSEKEKSEQRRKNGRSSAAYKADAEQKLNAINRQIDFTVNNLERQFNDETQEAIDTVLNDQSDIYENVIYLIYACDSERFAELDEEGRKLKQSAYEDIAEQNDLANTTRPLIEQINKAKTLEISWETRQMLWDTYREISDEFWCIRAELKQNYDSRLNSAYEQRRKAARSFYDAMYFLNSSRGWISLFASLIMVCSAMARESIADKKIQKLKIEKQKLISNTASFKKYSNAYRDVLKSGKKPLDDYLNAMEDVVTMLDREAEHCKIKQPAKQQEVSKTHFAL